MNFFEKKDIAIINTNPSSTVGTVIVDGIVSECGLFAIHKSLQVDDNDFYVTHLPTGCKCSQWFESIEQCKKYVEAIKPLCDWSNLKVKKKNNFRYGASQLKDKKLSEMLKEKTIKIRSDIFAESENTNG
jgi:hypothetical protein